MAGHSKWANIKHRKSAQDAIRSKEFMKLAKEIFVAAQMGGPDIASNSNLRLAISKAKSKSMPAKNIKKAIDKAIGAKDESANYDEYLYEGYLPGGVSVMVNCLTDNHNRLAANVKSLFNKNGGSIGKTGAVSYLFERLGIIEIDKSIMNEEKIMDLIIEFDPQDISETNDSFVITCLPTSFNKIKEVLESNGVEEFKTVEIKYIPNSLITLSTEKANKIIATINKFEDDEDIQEVFHNLDTSILDK